MTKRFLTIFFVTIGIALLGVCVCALILFIAPGVSIFGIRYIATGTHQILKNDYTISEVVGTFSSGSIRIESEDVPVCVYFTTGYVYEVEYIDNYCGLTTSKIDRPTITFSKDDEVLVVKVTSFKTFIYENGNSNRRLTIKIPAAIVCDSDSEREISVISQKAPVSFAQDGDSFIPDYNKIKVETSGKVTFSTSLKAKTYSLKTKNSININGSEKLDAYNYNLNSTNGNIVIEKVVEGDVTAKTNNASIKILSCENFTAESGWGDIYCSKNNETIKVNGIAKITTTAGSITIGEILGQTGKSIINTKTGAITITKMFDGEVSTTRGRVDISSANDLVVTTSTGQINIVEVLTKIKAESTYGKISLGGNSIVLNNPTVKSVFGDVDIKSAGGKVVVETINSNLKFVNTTADDIKFNIGGNIEATHLTGKVNVTYTGDTNLAFDLFTDDAKINNTSGASLTVYMINNDKDSFVHIVDAGDYVLYEYNTEDPNNPYRQTITEEQTDNEVPKLEITSAGRVVVYRKNMA